MNSHDLDSKFFFIFHKGEEEEEIFIVFIAVSLTTSFKHKSSSIIRFKFQDLFKILNRNLKEKSEEVA
jgi:hypothetical protein